MLPKSYMDFSIAAAFLAFSIGVPSIMIAETTANEAVPAPTYLNYIHTKFCI